MYKILIALMLVVGFTANATAASKWVNYSPESFVEAQSAGKTIVVDVAAEWCPTCRVQAPILDELAAEEALQNVMFVRVDFDTHKDFLREHRIPRQSTILVFDGASEINRSIAETNRERLRSFVLSAVTK